MRTENDRQQQEGTNLRFIGGENRGVYTSGNVNGGKKTTFGVEAWGTDHKIILTVDNSFDLGAREYVSSNYRNEAFTSGSKGYFRIISQSTNFIMHADDAYYMRGSYRFCGA